MSIGYTNAISGNFSMQSNFNGPVGPLGGGIKGFMPQQTNDSYNSDYFAQNRFTLREAWNTNYRSILKANGGKRIITPFRAVNNAGDLLSRENYSCGGSCQTFQSRPGLHGLRTHFGAIQSVCDKTNVPPSACNVKYVYDSSDYIKFKRQSASVKNYNDLSNAGDRNSASQSAYRAIRRY